MIIRQHLSVMQSEGKTFGGDVVLKSVNWHLGVWQHFRQKISWDWIKCISKVRITRNSQNYIWYKMLSSALHVLIKLFKTTSPQKLFPSDCITFFRCITRARITTKLCRSLTGKHVSQKKPYWCVTRTNCPYCLGAKYKI